MKQKILSFLILLWFFFGGYYFFSEEYWVYHEKQNQSQERIGTISQSLQWFEVHQIQNFADEISLFSTPNPDFLDQIIAQIDAAKERIFVEVYIFTERDIKNALLRAHERGVEVKVLLENNPYMTPYINDSHYEEFETAGVEVKWSDPLLYSLNHSKLLIIDDLSYIATGNFSYASFTKNREFFVALKNQEIGKYLQNIFLSDFSGEVFPEFLPQIVLSPESSRQQIEKLIYSAHTSIDFYFPYMQDDAMEEILYQKVQDGVLVRGVVDASFLENNKEDFERIQNKWMSLSVPEKQKIHAKAILVDKTYLYIGSINFSRYSFDENREIWVLISDTEIIHSFQNIFARDF